MTIFTCRSVCDLLELACKYNITIPLKRISVEGYYSYSNRLYRSNKRCKGYVVDLDSDIVDTLDCEEYLIWDKDIELVSFIEPMKFPQIITWDGKVYRVHSVKELYTVFRNNVAVFNRVACGRLHTYNLDAVAIKLLTKVPVSEFRIPTIYRNAVIAQACNKPVNVENGKVYGFNSKGIYSELCTEDTDTSWLKQNKYMNSRFNLSALMLVGDPIDVWVYYALRDARMALSIIPASLDGCVIGYDDLDVVKDEDTNSIRCVTMDIICKRYADRDKLMKQFKKNLNSVYELCNRYLLCSGYKLDLRDCSKYQMFVTKFGLVHCKFYV